MNRIKTWALCNLAIVALSVVITIVGAALAGIRGATVGGLSMFLLVLPPLLFLRTKGGKLSEALDERERAILGKVLFVAFEALLTAILVAGVAAVAAGAGGAGSVLGFLLVGGPYAMVLAGSLCAYFLSREPRK
jgi:hypothetical protein